MMNERQKELFVKEDATQEELQELFETIEILYDRVSKVNESIRDFVEIIESETIDTDIQNELGLLLENIDSNSVVKEVVLYFFEKNDFSNMNFDWSIFLFEECNIKTIVGLVEIQLNKDCFLKYLTKEIEEIQELIDKRISSNNSALEKRLKVVDEIFSKLK